MQTLPAALQSRPVALRDFLKIVEPQFYVSKLKLKLKQGKP